MPFQNTSPTFALLTAYDMRSFSGITAFTRGSTSVSMPTFASGEGVYEDALFFLNGRSSDTQVSATGQIDTVKTFGTNWAVSINENDHVTITASVDFTVTLLGSVDALGLGASVLDATFGGGVYTATFPNNWLRGSINLGDVSYKIDQIGGTSTFNFPEINTHAQDVTVFIRDRSSVSDDDAFALDSLEKRDQDALNNDNISWFINDLGHVACSYLSSIGDISWSSTTLRDKLGFTGNETPASYSSTYSLLTATHKASGVLIPSRPFQRHHIKAQNVAQSRRMIGGGYTSNHIGSYETSILNFDLDARLDLIDDYQHFLKNWVPFASAGERVNFYLSWGDSRRSLKSHQVNSSQPAYDTLFTSQNNGDYGRLRTSITTSQFDLAYPTRLRRRVPINIELEHV